jgi:hypothetical protein
LSHPFFSEKLFLQKKSASSFIFTLNILPSGFPYKAFLTDEPQLAQIKNKSTNKLANILIFVQRAYFVLDRLSN